MEAITAGLHDGLVMIGRHPRCVINTGVGAFETPGLTRLALNCGSHGAPEHTGIIIVTDCCITHQA